MDRRFDYYILSYPEILESDKFESYLGLNGFIEIKPDGIVNGDEIVRSKLYRRDYILYW